MSTPTPTPIEPHTFDTQTALAGLYLWLLFGFFTSLLGCDLQRIVSQNMFVKHFLALVCFFFLFTLLDPNNKAGVKDIWIKTVMVYALFVMSTKSKAWASILVVVLLILDQTIKMHMNYLQNNQPVGPELQTELEKYTKYRRLLYSMMAVIIVVGFTHYYFYQKSEYGDKFDLISFVFGTPKCREM
jgi:lysylphosphatidylglycerol synthetase-like protein (DUF2156 family)